MKFHPWGLWVFTNKSVAAFVGCEAIFHRFDLHRFWFEKVCVASPSSLLSQGVSCFAASALCLVASTSQAGAQVTFEEAEAALAILEQHLDAQPSPLEPVASVQATPPPEVGPTVLSDDVLAVLDAQADKNAPANTVDFLPILTEQSCPGRLPEIAEQTKSLTKRANDLEAEALALNKRFEKLEEASRANEIDQDAYECPSSLLKDIDAYQEDLVNLDLAGLIQEAETFSVCAQQGLQKLNLKMEELAVSDAPDAANERLAVGGVLRRWAASDDEVTEAVSNFVFYDQRRIRLAEATDKMQRRCQLLGGY